MKKELTKNLRKLKSIIIPYVLLAMILFSFTSNLILIAKPKPLSSITDCGCKENIASINIRLANLTEIMRKESSNFQELEYETLSLSNFCEHELFSEEEYSIATLIRLICQWREFDYELAYAFALAESGMNSEAIEFNNNNGTWDRGLYQFNDVFLEVYGLSVKDAHDPIISTEYFISHMSRMLEKYGDLHTAFRTYNVGEYGAIELDAGHAYADEIFKILGLEK